METYRRMKNSEGLCLVLPVIWWIIFNLPGKNGFFQKPSSGCVIQSSLFLFLLSADITFESSNIYLYHKMPLTITYICKCLRVALWRFFPSFFISYPCSLFDSETFTFKWQLMCFSSCTCFKHKPIFAGSFTYFSLAPWITVQECFLQSQHLTHLWVAKFLFQLFYLLLKSNVICLTARASAFGLCICVLDGLWFVWVLCFPPFTNLWLKTAIFIEFCY